MPGPGISPTNQTITDYAGSALLAARLDRMEDAILLVEELDRQGGGDGGEWTALAAMLWIDACLAIACAGAPAGGIQVLYQDKDTGVVESPEDNPPEFRWAAELIEARRVQDEERFVAIMSGIPDNGPNAVANHYAALLGVCAQAINDAHGHGPQIIHTRH